MQDEHAEEHPDRRTFVKKAGTVILGGIAALVPAGAGVLVFIDPLGRETSDAGFVKVASLSDLPEDGVPLKFSIVAERTDAWNKFPNVPIGAVYLRRIGEGKVEALNVICPHAGCFVDYRSERKGFFCPCHNSSFAEDGSIANPESPAARGMDALAVEIRAEREVWVKFENFRTGTSEKIPLA